MNSGAGERGRRWARPVAVLEPGVDLRDPAVLLLVGVWVAVTISQVALSLGEPKVYTPITAVQRPLPVWVDRVETVCDALVLLACVAAVGLAAWRRQRPDRPWLLVAVLAPWAALVAGQVLAGRSVGAGVLPYVALAGALWVLRPRMGVVEVLGYLTVAGAVLAIVLAVVAPSAGLYTGAAGYLAEKPIGPWGILAGFLPTGNNMGRFLSIGAASVLAIRDARVRWPGLALVAVTLVWTASRTSTATAALVVVGLVVLRLVAARAPRFTGAVAWVGLGLLAAVVVVTPFLVSSPQQFNHRAMYWMFLLDRWREQPWVGHGLDYFNRLAAQPQNLGGFAYHAHNVAVQLLVTGGLVAALAAAVVLALAARRAVVLVRAGVEWPVLVLVAVLAESVLEVPVSFADDVKANLPALLPLLVLIFARPAHAASNALEGTKESR